MTKAQLSGIPIPIKHSSCVKPANCCLRKMPCPWANREAHKPRTKPRAKPTQTSHLFQMSVLAGMQLGGQNPFSTLYKKKKKKETCFLMPAPRHQHIATQRRAKYCSNVGDRIEAIKHCLHHAWTARQTCGLPINFLHEEEREGDGRERQKLQWNHTHTFSLCSISSAL